MKKNLHSGGSCGKDRCHLDYNHYDSVRSDYYLDNLSVMKIPLNVMLLKRTISYLIIVTGTMGGARVKIFSWV